MKVYKTITIPIKTSKEYEQYLFDCNKECGKVWNECIRLSRFLWETEQKYVDRKYLQDNLKGFSKVITAKSIQMVAYKYLMALTAINQARRSGRTDLKYPWKQKKYYNMMIDKQNLQVNYDKNIIRIPRPITYERIINGKQKQSPIYLKCKTIPQNVTQIEFVYNDDWKLAINYFVEEENLQLQSSNTCAVDLGEIHSITSIDTNGNSMIITGREIRAIKRFRNKELGHLERKLSKCKKGSRNYKKYRKTIRKLLNKSNNKVEDSLKKTSKLFTNYVVQNNISTVVFGDLKNFNKNQKYTKKRKGQKQRLIQWEHGKLINLVANNVIKYGVKIEEISEKYTSQTCPFCLNKYKPTSRNYICKSCGIIYHRDLTGARNILSKYINNGVIKYIELPVKQLKYLRI